MRKFLKMYGENNSGRNTIMRLFQNNSNVISNMTCNTPIVSAQYRDYEHFKSQHNFTHIDYLKLKAQEVQRNKYDIINEYKNHKDHYTLNILNANSIFFKKDVVIAKADEQGDDEKYINFIELYDTTTIYVERNILIRTFAEIYELFQEHELDKWEDNIAIFKNGVAQSKLNINNYDKIIYHTDILQNSNKVKREISEMLNIPFVPCTFKGYNKYLTNHEFRNIYSEDTFIRLKNLFIKYEIPFTDISYDEMIYK